MRRLALGVMLLLGAPRLLRAQSETSDSLRRAQELYERLDIERALPLLRQVVSPSWPFEITKDQRVQALTYLGAALALAGARDSALLYFRTAIEREPFTDLDAQRFTPAQLALFREARRLTFAVAARPVASARVDPRTERVTFTVVTTHAAALRVELHPVQGQAGWVLFEGVNDGPREVPWDGLLPNARLAPPGRYELAVVGRSQLLGHSDSARVYFTLAHEAPPLEDTVPDLGPADLLPERFRPSDGRRDLLRGLGVAASAVAISSVAANGDLGSSGRALSIGVVGTAAIAGVTAFLSTRRERAVPANIEENKRRRATRDVANVAIARRNAQKVAQTTLVIEPAGGVGP